MAPFGSALYNITPGSGKSERLTNTIKIHRIEFMINISLPIPTLAVDRTFPIDSDYLAPADTEAADLGDYHMALLKRKITDPRLRILAVTPRKKLRTIPAHNQWPYYVKGVSDQ